MAIRLFLRESSGGRVAMRHVRFGAGMPRKHAVQPDGIGEGCLETSRCHPLPVTMITGMGSMHKLMCTDCSGAENFQVCRNCDQKHTAASDNQADQ